jgi:thiol:disulfide interchange protein
MTLFRGLTLLAASLLVTIAPLASAQPVSDRAKTSAVLNQSSVAPGQEVVLAVIVDIKRGFHAQSHAAQEPNIPLVVRPDPNPSAQFAEPVYPPGTDETYPGLGTINIYTGKVVVYVPARIAQDAKPGAMTLSGTARYQICDDKMCFAPERGKWGVETKVVAKGEPTPANAGEVFAAYRPPASIVYAAPDAATTSPTSRTSVPAPPPPPTDVSKSRTPAAGKSSLKPGPPPIDVGDDKPAYSFGTALGVAFLIGVLFNVMPCVLPVLPLKAMGFYEVAQHHRGKTILLALAFSLGIIAVFAALALLIVVFKAIGWSELFSRWWFAWSIILLLFVLSLGMFGAFTVNVVPSSLYSMTPRHDTYVGNFLFGILAAVLSTPCTAPLLPGLIIWAQTQPTAIGVASMVQVGVGMAFPYIVLSAFPEAARKFPRVGPWSELVKQMMGFLLLGSAVFFAAGRLIHSNAFWWSLAPVAAVASLYLMARTVQLSQNARAVAVASVLAVLMTGSVIFLAAYMTAGGGFEPVPSGDTNARSPLIASATVDWQPYSDVALEQARAEGKIVLVKFTAHWCLNCQAIEAAVFRNNQETADALRKLGVVTLKADLTEDDAPGWPRLKQLNSSGGIPLTAIYVPGYEQPAQLTSVYKTRTLVRVLDQASKVAVAMP